MEEIKLLACEMIVEEDFTKSFYMKHSTVQ